MEPDDSLPSSQEPANCSYSEPDQSIPCHLIPLPEDPNNSNYSIPSKPLQA
jgi:hypothetical protein